MNRGKGNGERGNLRAVGGRVELDRGSLGFPFPLSPFPFPEVFDQMRQIDFEIRQERSLRSRPRDLLEVDIVGEHRLLEQRPAQHDITGRAHHHRASGEPFATLESHQARERHPHAVLVRHATQDALPPHHARRQPDTFLVHPRAACRRRARHDHELGPLERGDRARERVPRVLADQDRRPPPAGVERPDLPPAIHEALLVEHAVGREEHLAVHLPDARVLAAERGVQARVVEVVLEDFVEPDRDVYGRGSRGLVLDCEIAEQCPRRDGHVPHAPFDEIAGRGGLGKHDQVHRRVELRDLSQHAADLL